MAEKLTLLDMFKNGTATWSSVSSFVVVLFWCVGCWLAFIAIVNYKNAADGKSGIAKPIIQNNIKRTYGRYFSLYSYFIGYFKQ